MLDYYVNTLNEYLQEFLDRNEIECDVELGTDFAYLHSKSKIIYSILVIDTHADSFLSFAEKLFPEIKADIFLWSFLHEVGHYETTDDFDDVEYEEYYRCIKQDNLDSDIYYNLPIEKAATIWAGEFMKKNIEEVQRLWNNIQSIIQAIYEKGE